MLKFNETLGDHTCVMHEISVDLKGTARAFARVGNSTMSEELFEIAEIISKSSSELHKDFGRALSDQLTESKKNAGETVRLCLDHLVGEGSA